MSKMVTIYIGGRRYEVPAGLTLMKAIEWAGFRLIRGAGCRGGFCGACATVYRLADDYKLNVALACQKTVEDGMHIARIPFTPAKKVTYDIDRLRPSEGILVRFYPEIARCVACNTCTRACPQDLRVMDYVQAALRGDLETVARLSFDCIGCGLCALRCPAEITPYEVAQLARRLWARYLARPARHLARRAREVRTGKFDRELRRLVRMPTRRLRALYAKREIRL
jgi:ferredoxin